MTGRRAPAAIIAEHLARDPWGAVYGSGLHPQHAAKLAASKVSAEVARARGYVTADSKAQLGRFGFGAAQQRPPALIIPLRSVTGDVAGHQLRADDPRCVGGRVAKYETKTGTKMVLDVPPRVRPMLGDPSIPLVVTEGPIKADAGATAGLASVALLGVWAWRGTNADGGKVALADWEYVALNGRQVVIAFDSDVMLKTSVYEALGRLGEFLGHRGAEVAYAYLPAGDHGTKVGLDDWLAGHTVEEFWPLVTPELRRPPSGPVVESEPEDIFDDVAGEPGAELLDDAAGFFRRFVAFGNEHQATAVALWTAHTHCVQSFDSTPRLAVTSPEKQSGKTRLLEVLHLLCRASKHTNNMSAAYMFRSIEATCPTLLVDEVDTIFRPGDKVNEDLRGLINAGHRKTATVGRMVGEGSNMVPTDFPAFCPVALAGIGKLPDTIHDRSVFIRLNRRSKDQVVEPFRAKRVEPEAVLLRRRLAAWAKRNIEQLAESDPVMPAGMVDRPADVWEPLLAIADAAGGHWPETGRHAAVALDAERATADPSWGVMLLADIEAVFTKADGDHMRSVDLVTALIEEEESPWGDLRGKALDARGLARKLKPYDIKPHPIRIGALVGKGYEAADFAEAWFRYLPRDNTTAPCTSTGTVTSVTAVTPQVGIAKSVTDGGSVTVTPGATVTEEEPLTCSVTVVTDVTDNQEGKRGNGGNGHVSAPELVAILSAFPGATIEESGATGAAT